MCAADEHAENSNIGSINAWTIWRKCGTSSPTTACFSPLNSNESICMLWTGTTLPDVENERRTQQQHASGGADAERCAKKERYL